MELAEYRYKIHSYEPKPLGFLPLLWFRYLRLEGGDSSHNKFIGFVKYLQRFWGADELWQLPFYAAFMSLRRLRAIAVRCTNLLPKMLPLKNLFGQFVK